jgi:hypothetical protein
MRGYQVVKAEIGESWTFEDVQSGCCGVGVTDQSVFREMGFCVSSSVKYGSRKPRCSTGCRIAFEEVLPI